MNPTGRLQPIGLIAFLCALIASVGLFALATNLATPSAYASLHSAQAGKALPQSTPTAPPGCVLDWSIVNNPDMGTASSWLYSISASSADDVWAVGSYSEGVSPTVKLTLVEHWNGSEWSVVPSPNPGSQDNDLRGVDALSADDVWAVGTYRTASPGLPLLMHWDGSGWNTVPGPASACDCTLDDVEAVSPNDVWAVGVQQSGGFTHPLIIHWDGSQWTMVPSPFDGIAVLAAIHAVSASDIWAVGTSYTSSWAQLTLTMHWDGVSWSVVSSPNWENSVPGLLDVTAYSEDDVWAVGYTADKISHVAKGLILHWNGDAWEVAPSPDPVGTLEDYLLGVTALSADDVWALGVSSEPVPGTNGDRPLSMHWDGTSWTTIQVPLPPMASSIFYAAVGISHSDVWGAGYSRGRDISPSRTLMQHYTYACSTPSPTETSTPMPATSTHTPASTFTPIPTSTSPATSTTTPASTAT